ncbi:unnamed protein product [Ectocarpus sp. CCAP 1310/34]|nr:unnamed protein product [Ectocarpus sp. CCAP 1310/34]
MHVAVIVATSMATGEAERGLDKEICDRFRRLQDFDRKVMTELFHLSIVNDRVRVLLEDALVRRKKTIGIDIRHEFSVEFVLLFFGVVENVVRTGRRLGDQGHIDIATFANTKLDRCLH